MLGEEAQDNSFGEMMTDKDISHRDSVMDGSS